MVNRNEGSLNDPNPNANSTYILLLLKQNIERTLCNRRRRLQMRCTIFFQLLLARITRYQRLSLHVLLLRVFQFVSMKQQSTRSARADCKSKQTCISSPIPT